MTYSFRLFTLLLTLWAPALLAQTPDKHRISAHIKGLANQKAYLAHFYGPTQFMPRDTAQADAEGRLVFDGAKSLPGGLYMVVVNSKPMLQLVIGEQEFSFEADTLDIIGSMKVTGSRENTLFYDYQKYLSKKYGDIAKLRQQAGANPAATKQVAELQKEIDTYRKDFLSKNAGTLTAKLFNAASDPEVPTAPKLPNGRPDSVWVFNYYKSHFLDGFDFSDERMVRTPFLQQKLERYLKELTVQTVDSLIPAADYLVNKAKANKDVLSYTIWFVTNQYEQQKTVLNTEGLFVHMAEKYWLTGVMPLNDTATRKDIRERVRILKPLLAGKVLPNLALQDTLGRVRSLHDIKADYTVVFFYSPECGHCRESAPKLRKFYEANKAKGLQIYAVAIDQKPEDWKKFIREFKIGNMVNVYGPSAPISYRDRYDVYSTPTVYILDKNKKILARRLPVEDLEGYLDFLQRQQVRKSPPTKEVKASIKKS